MEFTPCIAEQLQTLDTSGFSIPFCYVSFSSLETQFPYLRVIVAYGPQSCFSGLREAGSIKASYDFLVLSDGVLHYSKGALGFAICVYVRVCACACV